jgi:uncharacterized membrane protein
LSIENTDRREGVNPLAKTAAAAHIACMTLIRKNTALAKTVTFAMVHFTVAFGVGYLLTGSVAIASALALLEPLANTFAYYAHERLWARLNRAFALPASGLPQRG